MFNESEGLISSLRVERGDPVKLTILLQIDLD
jgi:hypothetical protein